MIDITGYDHFLMSITDLVSVSVHKGVVKQIITTNGLASYIFSKLHIFQLGRSVIRVMAETYASFHIDRMLSRITPLLHNSTTRKTFENRMNMTDTEEEIVELVVHGVDVEHLMHDIGIFAFHYTLKDDDQTNENHSEYQYSNKSIAFETPILSETKLRKQSSDTDLNIQQEHPTSRHLLQSIREYTSLTASSADFNSFFTTDRVVDTWLEVGCNLYVYVIFVYLQCSVYHR
jgi:hypothetical protein